MVIAKNGCAPKGATLQGKKLMSQGRPALCSCPITIIKEKKKNSEARRITNWNQTCNMNEMNISGKNPQKTWGLLCLSPSKYVAMAAAINILFF